MWQSAGLKLEDFERQLDTRTRKCRNSVSKRRIAGPVYLQFSARKTSNSKAGAFPVLDVSAAACISPLVRPTGRNRQASQRDAAAVCTPGVLD